MNIGSVLIIIFGLCLFEVVSSIDNAIINAEVLTTLGQKARRWFLTWGLFIAVFLARGLLPWIIVWAFNPSLGFIGSLTATFSSNPEVIHSIEKSAPILLIAGGTFLLFLFFHWLFLEDKHFGLPRTEKFFLSKGVWFYAVVSILLAIIVWCSLKTNDLMAFGAVIGSTAFFITHGFKQNAEQSEQKLMQRGISDISKLLYLEIIDLTFSIDGVLGAFAFTLAVPLILVGNGIGALVVRQLTIGNIDRIKKYIFLKNGAMYSILFLGLVMILDSFGLELPEWLSPVLTTFTVAFFFWKSKLHLRVTEKLTKEIA